MNVAVIGLGYVGAVTATGLARLGHAVTGIDMDTARVKLIQQGKAPVYEPGLAATLAWAVKEKKLTARSGMQLDGNEVVFICVGTPSKKDGSTDLQYVRSVTEAVGKNLPDRYPLIVVKSTVPPGTTESLIPLIEKSSGKKYKKDFGIAMNPEFLREGKALEDFAKPDRIVIGAEDEKSRQMLDALYASFSCPKLRCNLRTAEMIKYASNAFLATKISFINEMAGLCDVLGIDVYEVAQGMGYDPRIGRSFLNAGIGYGGSCFPKDANSLIHVAKAAGIEPKILQAAAATNISQPLRLVEMTKKHLGELRNKKIALLGLAFKPDTNDIREAPALKIIVRLLRDGVHITAYDPQAMENTRKVFGDKLTYATSVSHALKDAEACLLLTEWEEFKKLDAAAFASMKRKLVIEGRNCLDREKLKGIEYHGIGRGI